MKTIELKPLTEPVKKTITLPGSKSHTNRVLIMASLCNGKSVIKNISSSNDSLILLQALKKLGIKIIEKKDQVIIQGKGCIFPKIRKTLNVKDAGTAMRFLASFCSLIPGEIILDGSTRMRERPIAGLVETLRKLGTQIEYVDNGRVPPLKIRGGTIKGGTVSIKGNVSSQFISSLLMIGPLLENGLVLEIIGNQVSKSYIDMTINGLRQFGIKVTNKNYKKYVIEKNQKYKPATISIEGDASGASYFFGIAAVTSSEIKVKNINPNSSQGDVHFPDILKKMGCLVKKNEKEQSIEVRGPKELHSIDINMESMPDTAQTLAVIASFAKGKTKIAGLSTLPMKETDRLKAIHFELKKMGIKTNYDGNSITIQGGSPHEATVETYNDHRMAMAFAIAGSNIPGIKIKNPDVIGKSFPDFWKKINSIGIETVIHSQNKNTKVVFIGFMGSGKTSVSQTLAKKLLIPCIEMDDLILESSERKTVNEIFDRDGEIKFRELETATAKKLKKNINAVISTGGGIVMNKINLNYLNHGGKIVFLNASFGTIQKRLSGDHTRPLFRDLKKAKKLFNFRQPLYQEYSNIQIDTDNLSIDQVVTKLVNELKPL